MDGQTSLFDDEGRPSMHPASFDPPAAQELAEEGMEKARNAQRVVYWKYEGDMWLATLKPGTLITADDLTAAIGLPDIGPSRNNVVGAWFSGKSKKEELRFAGTFRPSERPERHRNFLRVWEVM
jgi:hypothetical protein